MTGICAIATFILPLFPIRGSIWLRPADICGHVCDEVCSGDTENYSCKNGNPQYCAMTWSEAVGLALTNPGGYAEYCL